jgi:signal transduction histidine kinase
VRAWTRRAGPVPGLSLALVAGVCVATSGLVWQGYRATREWRNSSIAVLEQQADATLWMLTAALNRDLKGAQASLLLPLEVEDVAKDPPHDLRRTLAARGFARYPYPEWFFIAHAVGEPQAHTWLFSRAERPPAWEQAPKRKTHPVLMTRDPAPLRGVVDEIQRRSVPGARLVVFDWVIEGTVHHIVAKSMDGGPKGTERSLAGFAVNLQWMREHYFSELLAEISNIDQDDISDVGDHTNAVLLAVVDDTGAVVAATDADAVASPRARRFPFAFFDPATNARLPAGTPPAAEWQARAAVNGRLLAGAARSAQQTFAVLALAAVASLVGVLLTARAVQARAELAAMKSEFVATVTHELKAPIAVIQLAADTLATGRYTSAEAIPEYARLASLEAARLTRLVENLLTYARVSDAARGYRFEGLEVAELVEDVLTRFRPRLVELGFETTVDVPLDLPRIRGDRTAVFQALDNVMDNAIKYSTTRRDVSIRGRTDGATVSLEVTDRGRGIPDAERPHIFDRFYRGRAPGPGGSGLGLAIVDRVVADHGGRVEVSSGAGDGTTVTLILPADRS